MFTTIWLWTTLFSFLRASQSNSKMKALDEGNFARGIFVYFQKTFVTVDHNMTLILQ